MSTALFLALLPFGGSGVGSGDELAVFVGQPDQTGAVALASSVVQAPVDFPPELMGIELEPIELAGRIPWKAIDPSEPRFTSDVPGAGAVLLPDERGAVLRFKRPLEGGGASHGYLWIAPDGSAHALAEQPGVGGAGDESPFLARIAVARAGDALLVATTIAAGGNLLEIELATGAAIDRTTSHAPLTFLEGGLALLPTWGVGLHTGGVVRFPRASGGVASDVGLDTPNGSATSFTASLATSADGSTALTTAGDSPTAAYPFAFRRTGPATRVFDSPQQISPAGYLPDSTYGPFLALSDDGSSCAWRSEILGPGDRSTEAWLAPTGLAPEQPFQLTQDSVFDDTLDEAGLFGFVQGSDFLFGIGELQDDGLSLESMDFHRATLASGGGAVIVNVSLSSGTATPPFDAKPTIDARVVQELPGTERYLVLDTNVDELIAVDAATSQTALLLSNVRSLDAVAWSGGHALVSVTRDPTGSREVWRLAASAGAPTLVFSLRSNTQVDRIASRGDGVVAYAVSTGAGTWLVRTDLTTGASDVFLPVPLPLGPSLGFSPTGHLGFSIGSTGAPALHFAWSDGGSAVLIELPVVAGFLLPAR